MIGRGDLVARGAVLVVAAAAAAALAEFPAALDSFEDRAADNAAQTDLRRELTGAHAIDVSRGLLLAARRLIAEDETFVVVTGPHVEVSMPVTLLGVADYAQYWLLPRRKVAVAEQADWLVCYGCDPDDLGLDLRVAWSDGAGISLARIGR